MTNFQGQAEKPLAQAVEDQQGTEVHSNNGNASPSDPTQFNTTMQRQHTSGQDLDPVPDHVITSHQASAFTTPPRPIQALSDQHAVTLNPAYMRQIQDSLPQRKITKRSCLAMMKRIDYEVEAWEGLARCITEHQNAMDDFTERLYQAVMQYFGFQGVLTVQQNTEATRFVLAIIARSQQELNNATNRQLPHISDVPNAFAIHLESIVIVLTEADDELRPTRGTQDPLQAHALVRIAAMRWQRELIQEWIEWVNLSPAARAIRANDIAQRDDAADTPLHRRAGRPEGTVMSKSKSAKKQSGSRKNAVRSVLQSPFMSPTRCQQMRNLQIRDSPIQHGSSSSLQSSASSNPTQFQQIPGQQPTGPAQGQRCDISQRPQNAFTQPGRTPEQLLNETPTYNSYGRPIFTPRAVHQP